MKWTCERQESFVSDSHGRDVVAVVQDEQGRQVFDGVMPHIAGASVRTVTYAAEQAAEEVRRFIAGLPPVNPC